VTRPPESKLPALEASFLTHEIEPVEFRLKQRLEDFRVQELPLYTPGGEGDHLYLHVEKRDRTTLQAVGALARALGRKRREFGYAGMKDRHGVTRQWISIEHVTPQEVARLELEGLRVLEAVRHRNKLRLGHLLGNRFCIALRGLPAGDVPRVRECLALLEQRGLPNWFGEQRFGRAANGHELGARLLAGEWREYLTELVRADCESRTPECVRAALAERDPELLRELAGLVDRPLAAALERLAAGQSYERAASSISVRIRQLHLSAIQSHVFNLLLAERLAGESLTDWLPLEGDVCWIHASGASFVPEAVDEELLRRVREFEISPAGPLNGSKLLAARGEAARREQRLLKDCGLEPGSFGRAGLRGARRPCRVPLRDVLLEPREGVTWLEFSLPKGSYATALVAELRKRFSGRESGTETARSGSGGTES
jgi:tRNA pseudouridine13 synthase